MKKLILLVTVIVIHCIAFYGPAYAISIGDLEEKLRISGPIACVRPILVMSLEDKLDVYITGEAVKSAAILQSKNNDASLSYIEREKTIEKLYFEGGIYFDFKDEELRKATIANVKKQIKDYQYSVQQNKELGKNIPPPDAEASILLGQFYRNHYRWATIGFGKEMKDVPIDDMRFFTMRVTALLPISSKDWKYDAKSTKLVINRRIVNSSKPMKLCGEEKLISGVVDQGSGTMNLDGSEGGILTSSSRTEYILNTTAARDAEMFQNIIHNIVWKITTTRDTIDVQHMR
ncbi:MAG: hypothetical protein ACOYOS_14065 [Syntrophales bacterium]